MHVSMCTVSVHACVNRVVRVGVCMYLLAIVYIYTHTGDFHVHTVKCQ